MFVAANAPTEETPEGQKAKYMVALNSTVASVPAQKYLFVLPDANAKKGKRGKRNGEAGSKVLGTYGRDLLKVNNKISLRFAGNSKLDYMSTLFCTPKMLCPTRSKTPTAERDRHVWAIF